MKIGGSIYGIIEIHNQIMEIRSPTNVAFMEIHNSYIHQPIIEIQNSNYDP